MTRPRRRSFRPILEGLDDRCLLSTSGLTPAQVTKAYGLTGLTFGTQAGDGTGQTIAVVDSFNDPNIRAELAVFDAQFNLADPPSLTILGQSGTSFLPANDADWAQEIALDVEWAHAMAPRASIVLIEASSTETRDLMAAVKTAVSLPGVSVVSMSWGGDESNFTQSFDGLFATPGITFVASSGDDGPSAGAVWPASSPYVLGVGGTSIQVAADGTYQHETAWSGSSGGYSTIEPRPSYQATFQSNGFRSTPDVAFDGDPQTGVQVYSIDAFSGRGSWLTVGGTSLGAPAWAGLVAVADQGRVLAGAKPLSSLQTLSTLYSLPVADFHSISGSYDTQTGRGTPVGNLVINALASANGSTSTTLATSTTTTTTPTTPTNAKTPVVNRPIRLLPVITQPVFTQPVLVQPVATQPVISQPVNSQPVLSTPINDPVALTPAPAAAPIDPTQLFTKHVRKVKKSHAKAHHKAHVRVPHAPSTVTHAASHGH